MIDPRENKLLSFLKRRRVLFAAAFAYAVVSYFFLHFLLKDAGGALMGGDGIFTFWAVSWDIHSFMTQPLDIFNANIFFPSPGTLAYSESTLVPAFLVFVFSFFTRNLILAYNFLIFLSFVLSAFGAFLLARYLTKNNYAAFIAGLIFGFGTPHLAGLGHFQNLVIFWIPFSILFLQKYFDTSKRKYLLIASLLFSAQMLSSWYMGSFLFLLFLFLIVVNYRFFAENIRKTALDGLFALLIAVALIAPVAYPYLAFSLKTGFSYPIQDAVNGSADIGGYVLPSPDTPLFFLNSLLGIKKGHWAENANFLGFFPMLLVLFYVLFLRKKIQDRNFKIFFWGIFFFVILSFGPYARFLGKFNFLPLPYWVVYNYLHFGFIRAPGRLSVIALLCLSVSVAYILAYLKPEQNKKYWLVAFLIPMYILFENWISFSDKNLFTTTACPAIYSVVKNDPSVTSLVELPVSPAFTDMDNTLAYIYNSTCHFKPIFNGYSGFAPPDYNENALAINAFPEEKSIPKLKELGISHVLLHLDRVDSTKKQTLEKSLKKSEHIEKIAASGNDFLYKIKGE